MKNNSTIETTNQEFDAINREVTPMNPSTQEPDSEMKQVLKKTKEEARVQAVAVLEKAKESAIKRANSYTDEVSERIHSVEKATRKAADSLRDEEPEFVTQAFDWLSDQTEVVARYFEERDAKQIADDARGLIRKNPTAFLSGLAAAGFLTGRFLKATEPDRTSETTETNLPA